MATDILLSFRRYRNSRVFERRLRGSLSVTLRFGKVFAFLGLRKKFHDFASEFLSEENFNTNNVPVHKVKYHLSRRRIQRKGFVVGSIGLLRFGSRIERSAEIITTVTPVNELKLRNLLD